MKTELLFLWQLSQMLLGELYFVLTNDETHRLVSMGEALIFIGDYKGGMTLGKYIFLSERLEDSEYIIRHEFGHVKQSKMLGPLYLLVIGLPSIIWAALHSKVQFFKKYNYYSFYTEKWANKLAGLK